MFSEIRMLCDKRWNICLLVEGEAPVDEEGDGRHSPEILYEAQPNEALQLSHLTYVTASTTPCTHSLCLVF